MNRELAMTLISRAMDGELPERQRAELEAWLAAHPEDRELAEQWKRIGALAREASVALPVPDEALAWQDIRRAIRTAAPEAESSPFFRWRLAWAAGMVATVCALLLAGSVWNGRRTAQMLAKLDAGGPAQIEWAETDVPGASTMVYQDEDSGVTVVWLMTDENGEATKKSG